MLFLCALLFQLLNAHLLIFGHLFVDILYLEVLLFFVLLFYLNSFSLLLLDLIQPLLGPDHWIHDLFLPFILNTLRLIKYFLHIFFFFLWFFVCLITLLLPYIIKHFSFFNWSLLLLVIDLLLNQEHILILLVQLLYLLILIWSFLLRLLNQLPPLFLQAMLPGLLPPFLMEILFTYLLLFFLFQELVLSQPLLKGFPFDLVFDLYIPDPLPLYLLQLLPRYQVPRPHSLHPLLVALKLPALLLILPDLISPLLFLLVLPPYVQLLQQFRLPLLLLKLKRLLLLPYGPPPLLLLHYGLNFPLLLLLHAPNHPHFLLYEGGVLLLEEGGTGHVRGNCHLVDSIGQWRHGLQWIRTCCAGRVGVHSAAESWLWDSWLLFQEWIPWSHRWVSLMMFFKAVYAPVHLVT